MTRRFVWIAAVAASASSATAFFAADAAAQARPVAPTSTPASPEVVVVTPTAQSAIVVIDRPAPRERPPGTHFLLEGYAGGTVVGGFGGYGGIRLGAGGKPPSIPWRFYLIGEIAYTTASTNGNVPATGEMFDEGRQWLDLAVGGRALVPIVEPVRFFVDMLGGASWGTAWIERPDAPRIAPDGWHGLFIVGAGLQVRINEEASVGARLALRLTGDPLDELRSVLGIDGAPPMTASAGLTWHW